MKKTAICLLLVFTVLVGITACNSKPENETETETVSAAEEQNEFPVISDGERGMFFRYYYISVWSSVCINVRDNGYKFGYGENFDPAVSPDEQYFLGKKDGEPVLWSDELAVLAANDSNRTISIFNDAVKSGDFKLKDSDLKSINDTIEQAQKSAESKGLSLADYLTGYYGFGFTPKFFEKMLTVEQTVHSYTVAMQNSFMSKRSKTESSYEECSELAVGDYQDYSDKLLSENTDKFFVDDVYCTDGKAAALACIEEKISGNKN